MNETNEFSLVDATGAPTPPVRKRGRPGLTDEQKAERNRQNVRDWRWKNRAVLADKADQERFARSRFGICTANWTKAFSALPPEEQQRIDELHTEAWLVLREALDVIAGIANGKEPGRNMPFPDLSYRFVTDFVTRTGIGNSWPDLELLALLEPADFDSLTADDEPLRKYGRFTKISSLIYSQFEEAVWRWAEANRNECEPDIYTELERKCHKAATTPERADITPESQHYIPQNADRQGATK
jgi:hypothetical protein